MKAFISIDLEGMPYVVILGQLNLKGSQYEEIRKIATQITLLVTDELHKNGASVRFNCNCISLFYNFSIRN